MKVFGAPGTLHITNATKCRYATRGPSLPPLPRGLSSIAMDCPRGKCVSEVTPVGLRARATGTRGVYPVHKSLRGLQVGTSGDIPMSPLALHVLGVYPVHKSLRGL